MQKQLGDLSEQKGAKQLTDLYKQSRDTAAVTKDFSVCLANKSAAPWPVQGMLPLLLGRRILAGFNAGRAGGLAHSLGLWTTHHVLLQPTWESTVVTQFENHYFRLRVILSTFQCAAMILRISRNKNSPGFQTRR